MVTFPQLRSLFVLSVTTHSFFAGNHDIPTIDRVYLLVVDDQANSEDGSMSAVTKMARVLSGSAALGVFLPVEHLQWMPNNMPGFAADVCSHLVVLMHLWILFS
jgi:hypothetical protein